MENNVKISVLTPTYNRAELLKRLYKSLVENSQSGIEIEWLIMDDGSTDNTKQVVEELEKENNKIELKYYKQENYGKMVALNHLVEKTTGDLIIECDDDDYFMPNAFKTIKNIYDKVKDEKNIYAMCFLKYDQNGNNMGNLLKKERTTMFDLYFKEGETGEKALVFFRDIRKKYRHELEKNEKFITEARMYHKMDLDNEIFCVNEPIMICEYQKEGYTKNIQEQFCKNPYGYYEYFKEIFDHDMKEMPFKKRIYLIKHYILFSYLTKKYDIKSVKKFKNKILYVVLLIPGIIKSSSFAKKKN